MWKRSRTVPALFLLLLPATLAAQDDLRKAIPRPSAEAFASHWYAGKAELNSYRLTQFRYGETHKGHAVLIFVKEDFLKKELVKANKPGPLSIPVLKLNDTRKFLTGIYPYSMMNSVFTKLSLGDGPATVKVSTSIQEWCGHVYQQLLLRAQGYEMQRHSYFQGEADETRTLPKAMLEDEIWTRLRLAPWTLPLGETAFLPGAYFGRLRHQKLRVEKAKASLSVEKDADVKPSGKRFVYRIAYESGRSLELRFEGNTPFRILSFREEIPLGGGKKGVTTAELYRSKLLPYWQLNKDRNRKLRKDLGLDPSR